MLFLYNKMLHQQEGFVHRQQKRVGRRARQHPGLVSGDTGTRDGGLAVTPICPAAQPESPPQGMSLLLWCSQRWPFLRRWVRGRCTVCEAPETHRDRLCPAPACGARYCRLCWRQVGRTCLLCSPGEPGLAPGSSDEEDVGYAD